MVVILEEGMIDPVSGESAERRSPDACSERDASYFKSKS
jgi:hypothetical protein